MPPATPPTPGDRPTGPGFGSRARARFPATGLGARAARRFASSALGADNGSDVALVVSELAANAVRHAETPFELALEDDGRRVRVEVRDGSPTLPSPRGSQDDGITGRGLLIVEHLSSAWGARQTAGGKVVWAELPSATARRLPVLDHAPPG